jgi:hypothetical protein
MDPTLQALSTEYMNLQYARGIVIAETNGRVTFFLGALSSAVVAVAFAGQGLRFGPPFLLFTVVLLIPLIFIGVATYVRVQQASIEDAIYERGMNRIRRYIVETAPQAQPYLVLSTNDDLAGTMHNLAIRSFTFEHAFTVASMVGVINGVLVGTVVALIIEAISRLQAVSVGCGVVTAAAVMIVEAAYQRRSWKSLEIFAPPRFPTL